MKGHQIALNAGSESGKSVLAVYLTIHMVLGKAIPGMEVPEGDTIDRDVRILTWTRKIQSRRHSGASASSVSTWAKRTPRDDPFRRRVLQGWRWREAHRCMAPA